MFNGIESALAAIRLIWRGPTMLGKLRLLLLGKLLPFRKLGIFSKLLGKLLGKLSPLPLGKLLPFNKLVKILVEPLDNLLDKMLLLLLGKPLKLLVKLLGIILHNLLDKLLLLLLGKLLRFRLRLLLMLRLLLL